MIHIFSQFSHLIVYLHVLGAFVWVGGMIAIRFAVHPTLQTIEDPAIKLGKTLALVGRFFNIVIPFIVIIVATGMVMAVALNGHHGTLKPIFMAKEIIWTVMTINFSLMYFKRYKAQKSFDKGDLATAKAHITLIPKLLLPLNIALGIVALWLGVTLRGY